MPCETATPTAPSLCGGSGGDVGNAAVGALWSRMATDLDPEEETANFGTRLAIESRRGDLYDVVTAALFEPDQQEQVDGESAFPSVRSLSSECAGFTALAFGRCLHVIPNHDGGDDDGTGDVGHVSAVLAGEITCLAWSTCCRFVLAGLGNFRAQLVHLPTRKPLPSLDLHSLSGRDQSPDDPGQSLVHCHFGGSDGAVTLISSKAEIYTLNGLDLSALDTALREGDLASLKGIQAAMTCQPGPELDRPIEGLQCAANFTDENENQATILGYEDHVGLLDTTTGIVSAVLPLDYLPQSASPAKLVPTRILRGTMLCLDDSGSVHVVSLDTMTTTRVWSKEEVLDLVLIEDAGDPFSMRLMMTVASDDGVGRALQMREFPSFKLLYSTDVSPLLCFPVHCGVSQETPRFIEGSRDEEEGTLSMRLRSVCETVVESRLQRLIRRRRFTEAEMLARTFKLPLQDLHKAKATFFTELLSPWREPKPDEVEVKETLEELTKVLRQVEDLNFVVECCVTAALPKLNELRSLLLLARDAIRNNSSQQDVNLDLMARVSSTLQRLETFLLTPESGESRSDRNADIDQWVQFSRAEMSAECARRLSSGRLDQAKTIWDRHRSEFSLDPSTVQSFLDAMASKWDVKTKLCWLSAFIPDCLKECPECLTNVASWTVSAASACEQSRRSTGGGNAWPQDGMDLVSGVLRLIEQDCGGDKAGVDALSLKVSRVHLIVNRQRSDPSSALSTLITLRSTLGDLVTLHKQFRVRLKLKDVLTDDKRLVANVILDWCDEKAETALVAEGFLEGFLTRHGLECGKVLAEYLLTAIEECESGWHWTLDQAPWQPKAEALMPLIGNPADRADIILAAVRAAPVPWTQFVKKLAEEAANLSTVPAKAAMIREQATLVGLKRILKKNGCRRLDLRGRDLERLYQYMIKQGGEDGFQDAKEVARNCSRGLSDSLRVVEMHYIKHLLFGQGDSARSVEILQASTNAPWLGEKFVCHFEARIKIDPDVVFETEAPLAFVAAFERLTEIAEGLKERIDAIKRRVALVKEFTISLPCKGGDRLSLLREELNSLLDREDLAIARLKCARLCHLLEVEEIKGAEIFAKILTERKQHDEASEVLQHRGEVQGAEEIRDLLRCGTPDHGVVLASRASVAKCHKAGLSRSAELSWWCRVLNRTSLSSARPGRVELESGGRGPFDKWKLEPLFEDKGLPADKDIICKLKDFFINGNRPALDAALDTLRRNALTEQVLSLRTLATPTEDSLADVTALLKKSLGERKADLRPVAAYLARLSNRAFVSVVVQTAGGLNQEYSKVQTLGMLATKLCVARGLVSPASEMAELTMAAVWANRALGAFGVEFGPALSGHREEKRAVLVKLMQSSPVFTVQDVLIFCKCFGIPAFPAVVDYVKISLPKLEPKIVGGQVTRSDDFNATLDNCRDAMALIRDNAIIEQLATELLDELVSPYNYEVVGFVVGTMLEEGSCKLASKASQVLDFLSHYRRRHPPGPREAELWGERRAFAHVPFPRDGLARLRLPMTWMVKTLTPRDRFKILRGEFDLDNYLEWCDLSPVLKLQADNIRVMTVHNEVAAQLGSGEQTEEDTVRQGMWNAELRFQDMTKKVLSCVSGISDPLKAASCAHFYASRLPVNTPDRLEATAGFLAVAVAWDEAADSSLVGVPGPVAQAVSLTRVNLERLKVECALRRRGLWDAGVHEAMVAQCAPEEIVCRLLEETTTDMERCSFSDVLAAASDIAYALDLDLTDIKFQLLDKWLPERRSSAAGRQGWNDFDDETISVARAMAKSRAAGGGSDGGSADEDANNFARCANLASDGDPDVLGYLVARGFSSDDRAPVGTRLRALRALLSAADEDDIRGAACVGPGEVEDGLRRLHFAARLEKINLPGDLLCREEGSKEQRSEEDKDCKPPEEIPQMSASQRISVVGAVLRASGHLSEGVELAAELCLHLGVADPDTWCAVLAAMVRLDMADRLEDLLVELNRHPQLWHFDAFVSAWRFVLLRPFSRAGAVPIAEKEEKDCWKALALFRRCPLDFDAVDLKLIRGECRRLALNDLEKKFSLDS